MRRRRCFSMKRISRHRRWQEPKANGRRRVLSIRTTCGHDMHVTIVTFEPGAVIPFAETHVMEHGLYVLEGKAVYRLNQDWVEVEAGDYMWLRAFCPQACYAGGPGKFRYLLYKDVNRHMKLKPARLSVVIISVYSLTFPAGCPSGKSGWDRLDRAVAAIVALMGGVAANAAWRRLQVDSRQIECAIGIGAGIVGFVALCHEKSEDHRKSSRVFASTVNPPNRSPDNRKIVKKLTIFVREVLARTRDGSHLAGARYRAPVQEDHRDAT